MNPSKKKVQPVQVAFTFLVNEKIKFSITRYFALSKILQVPGGRKKLGLSGFELSRLDKCVIRYKIWEALPASCLNKQNVTRVFSFRNFL